ncbi:MAG TPA: HAMP domain-containing sensor histidine kinase [Candidatus Elarobacter sp.]
MSSIATRVATIGTIVFALALFITVEAVTLLGHSGGQVRFGGGPEIRRAIPFPGPPLELPGPASPKPGPQTRRLDERGDVQIQSGQVIGGFGIEGDRVFATGPMAFALQPSPWRRTFAIVLPLLAGLVAIVAFWFVLRFLARDALRPLDGIAEALNGLADGELPTRTVTAGAATELAGVAAAYNAAAERVATVKEEQARTQERMRQFVADAGHELRTPLTVISGYIDVLRRGAIAERTVAEDILTTMSFEKEHMRALIDRLLRLSRLDAETPPQIGVVELEPLLRSIATIAQHLDPAREISYALDGQPSVMADRDELSEAIWTLVENALKYAPGAPIAISARPVDGSVMIEVNDRGPGMTDTERTQAFQRFFRGDARGEVPGSGLGLAIAKRSVERSHGTIELHSNPGIGTTVRITLPAAP